MSMDTGEYLLWRAGERTFGLELKFCREIVNAVTVTQLPRAPEFLLGVANLRGSVIAVVDLEVLLGYRRKAEFKNSANLIRLRVEGYPVAVAVDSIRDSVFLGESELESAPANLADSENAYIRLVAKLPDCLVLIPDVNLIASKIN